MDVAKRIKELRKAKGISAETIAEQLGTNPTTIYRYEKGDIEKMPLSVLEPIAKILGCSPAYLMGWTDNPDENIISLPAFDIETIYKAIFETPYKKGSTKNVLGEEISSLQNERSVKDFKEAMKLYGHYKQASPRDRNIVDSLLKPDESDP